MINNLYDYVTGVETGLDSNGRKNRGGHLMENLVESYIKKTNIQEYYKEMYRSEIEKNGILIYRKYPTREKLKKDLILL